MKKQMEETRDTITVSQDNSGEKGPQEVPCSTFSSKREQFQGQTRLLKSLSVWVLKNLQEQRQHNFSGQPAPLSDCCPYIQFLLTSSLCPLSLILPPHTTVKCLVPVSPFFQHAKILLKSSLTLQYID